jgi:hypothetical protein
LGFGVWDLGFGVWGLGFGVWGGRKGKMAIESFWRATTVVTSCCP